MNKKVSLKEIVSNKIIYSIILTSYYWMWARTDWKDWYQAVQIMLACLLAIFFLFQAMRINKYKREGVDEMAEENLKRCDSICLKIFVITMIIVAWGCAVFGHIDAISVEVIGWIIVLSIMVLSVVRTILFVIMDSKGV